MENSLELIASKLTSDISRQLNQCGIMFRIFSRVKTENSISHKLGVKYANKKVNIQDMIGIRIVLYFQDDVDALALFYSAGDVVKKSIDEYDSSTFRPQRLNITRLIPEEMVADFRAALPQQYRDTIEHTYEIQIRTVFSEGWHEVEHDLRYKCSEDWVGCESYSRTLNGVIATLETAEWNMRAIFSEMAKHNFLHANYTAMLRNKFHLKLRSESLSPALNDFLKSQHDVAHELLNADRLIVLYTLLTHNGEFDLTYDNLVYLINRIEMMNPDIMAMEPENVTEMLNAFLNS